MAQRLIQAYQQAPWRTQVQWIGLFLLTLIPVAVIAGVYLSISAEATAAGIKIQIQDNYKDNLREEIANLESQLAFISSSEQMHKRADVLGFEAIDPNTAQYLVIPGYTGEPAVELAPKASADNSEPQILKPAYTQSLWEWIYQGVLTRGWGLGEKP